MQQQQGEDAGKAEADAVNGTRTRGEALGPKGVAARLEQLSSDALDDDGEQRVTITDMEQFCSGISQGSKKRAHQVTRQQEPPAPSAETSTTTQLPMKEALAGRGLAGVLELLHQTGNLKRKGQGDEDGICLEQRDELGRVLTTKESFRKFSSAFYGRAPGKNKQAKRLKRAKQAQKQESSSLFR